MEKPVQRLKEVRLQNLLFEICDSDWSLASDCETQVFIFGPKVSN